MSTEEIKRVTCYGCPLQACFVKAHIEDGVLVRVTPDEERPCVVDCNRGFLDYDGRAGIEYHYMENRLNYPLKRAGKRGENKWERISWEQALDEIADKLRDLKEKYGPHCMSVQTGTAHHSDNNWLPWRFHTAFGSVNHTGHEQICYGCNTITSEFSFGWPVVIGGKAAEGVTPGCAVMIANTHQTMPASWEGIRNLREQGMKLISVDPRLTEAGRVANMWLQIRPGSDIALWLCWIRLILKEGWYDKEFVEEWSNAPFLVRTDTEKMIRASEVVKEGSPENFVAWDTATAAPVIWDAEARKYETEGVKQALSGTYTVALADGTKIECRTAFDMLVLRVEEWTPEKAEELTWVPQDKILEACEMYATNRPGMFLPLGHVYDSFAPGSVDAYRCVAILRMLNGSVDRTEILPGIYDTNKCKSIYELELKPDEAFSPEEKQQQIGADKFKGLSFPGFDLKAKYEKKHWGAATCAMWSVQGHPHIMWRDILEEKPNRLRCMIISGSNPLLKFGNVKMVYEAMKKLDLIVTNEFVMTPTAMLSDYVLPMSDWFERPEIGPSLPSDMLNFIHVSGAAMEPEFERASDYDVFRGLAVRLGLGEHFPWESLEECYNWRMEGLLKEHGCKDINEFGEKVGFDYPEPIFENYKLKNGFGTATGKAEFWSTILETLGYDPIPHYCEPSISPYSTPELAEEYPLILIGIDRHMPNYHTMYFEVPVLRKRCPDPFMDMHPDTAAWMDPPISDGDWVWVETRRGRIKQRARLTVGIDPRVVKIQHHWWFPEQPGEEPYLHGVWQSNANVLSEDDPELCDPVFGTWPHNALLCRVYAVTDAKHL